MSDNTAIEQELDAAIQRHRTTNATVTLSHQGAPLANREVTVEQKAHKFLLGANWGTSIDLVNGRLTGKEKELAEQREHYFGQLFNQVTMPFYWGRFEPERGKPQTEEILNTARWYKERGFVLKGHPLCWHTVTADWLMDLSNAEILDVQIARIQREMADFAGVIDMWDVINEAVIMPVFAYDNGITRLCKDIGRLELMRKLFKVARETNPAATLLINDFNVSEAYDILIEACLEIGIPIDVIGIQTHMHQGYWGMERTQRILSNFGRFNLPIHFTEISLVSGALMPPEITDLNDFQVKDWPSTPEGEARQEKEVILHYKTMLAHPAVEAITWWDFSDGAWLNAPAGLLRADQTPKPSYDSLLKLVKGDWWLSPTKMTTDADGKLNFSGFLGQYAVTVEGQTVNFDLNDNGESHVSVTV